jgi:hypothetical protein
MLRLIAAFSNMVLNLPARARLIDVVRPPNRAHPLSAAASPRTSGRVAAVRELTTIAWDWPLFSQRSVRYNGQIIERQALGPYLEAAQDASLTLHKVRLGVCYADCD